MDFRQLETFRKVAQLRSLTRAATELRYAQSTVTAQIKSLESDLKLSLFDRSGRGVRLTAAGEQLLPYAERILDLVAEARRNLHPEREPSGVLTVGTMESITSYRLPPLLELFHHRYPKLQLSLRATSCTATRAALRQGTFDVGFLMEYEREHPGLASIVLCEEPLALVSAPKHPLAGRDRIDIAQLRDTTVLGTEPGCVYRDKFQELLGADGQDPYPVLEYGTIEAIKRSAEARLGVALLPKVTVAAELDAGSLVALAWPVPFRIYTQLAWNDTRWVPPEVRLFVSEATRVIREA
ncbi:MAG TPA: LysR family transcriptional regulator, partial [Micromonosporaceae bacterium]|nr:LysR family transcriptional regulator [Micromonosporaceae bacterium]